MAHLLQLLDRDEEAVQLLQQAEPGSKWSAGGPATRFCSQILSNGPSAAEVALQRG